MTEVLTGKRRFRTHRTLIGADLLVLQVEVSRSEKRATNWGSWVEVEDVTNTYWRDARVEDGAA